MNIGYTNEFDFVKEINGKKVKDQNPLFQDLIYTLFNNICGDDIVKSWRNHYSQKADIFIKIGPAMKGISIKMGSRNSVHVEHIDDFICFLKEHNIPNEIIEKYLKFHYGDGTINNTGDIRLSAEEYKNNNQKEIDLINKHFSNQEIIYDAIERFVLKGNNCNYCIDAIILGTPNDFFWICKKDIINVLNNHYNDYCSSPHFSNLVCQPMNRCLNRNHKYERFRSYVQIKWYSLFDNIIEQKNDNIMKKYF